MFSMRRLLCAAAVCCVGFGATVSAAPLNYNEAVDGDIVSSLVLSLDFGVNVVTGRTSGSTSPFGLDGDLFKALLPVNAVLDGFEVTLTTGTGGNGSFIGMWEYTFCNPCTSSFVLTGAGGTFTVPIDLAAAYIFLQPNNFPASAVNDYTIRISVSSSEVPIPAALPLFATILAGGGLVAWRRKRKSKAIPALA